MIFFEGLTHASLKYGANVKSAHSNMWKCVWDDLGVCICRERLFLLRTAKILAAPEDQQSLFTSQDN